jgi:hypothetical protein
MLMQSSVPRSLLTLSLVVFLFTSAQAKGSEMFVCTNKDGVRTYQNSDGGDGCVPLNLNPITVVPAPKYGTSKGVGGLDGANRSSGSGRSAAAYDSRSSGDFNASDDRMKILQEELRIEEGKLKSLKDEYKNGQPDRLGNERNYQKYLDRVSRLEQEIMVTNDNIEILKTELIRLAK